MDKLKLALTFGIIIGVIGLGLYWVTKNAEKIEFDRINAMRRGYKYSKGIIRGMHSYKGKSVSVKYQIEGVYFESSRGWDSNPRNLGVGDSVSLRYAMENPEYIITELEDDYQSDIHHHGKMRILNR